MAQTASPSIPLFDLEVEPEDLEAVAEALRAGELVAGERVAAFERAFAARLGVRHAVAVSSCTSALHLAYLAAGVGPGDEVIVPTYTFAATASAAVHCGATPVFADVCGPKDLGVDPDHVATRITARTKAVCVVHYAGYPADVASLVALSRERGIALIEDAAHAPSGDVRGVRLGTFGLVGCFSFFSNKVLSAGEGGLLATDDDRVAAVARALRDPAGYGPERPGFDHRLDEPRAALLLSRLNRLERDVLARRRLTLAYRARLAEVEGVTVPYRDGDVDHSACYVMPIVVDPERRDAVRAALAGEHGIQTSVLYQPVHSFTAYRERFPSAPLPRAEAAGAGNICLPLYPHLAPEDLERVVERLEEALR